MNQCLMINLKSCKKKKKKKKKKKDLGGGSRSFESDGNMLVSLDLEMRIEAIAIVVRMPVEKNRVPSISTSN